MGVDCESFGENRQIEGEILCNLEETVTLDYVVTYH